MAYQRVSDEFHRILETFPGAFSGSFRRFQERFGEFQRVSGASFRWFQWRSKGYIRGFGGISEDYWQVSGTLRVFHKFFFRRFQRGNTGSFNDTEAPVKHPAVPWNVTETSFNTCEPPETFLNSIKNSLKSPAAAMPPEIPL